MKKIAIFSLLALTLTAVYARPPIEGDVLDGNDFVFGVDVSESLTSRVDGTSIPYLSNFSNFNGQYVPISSHIKGNDIDQNNIMLNVNFRYGLFDYFEFFANGNGYYQFSSTSEEDALTKTIDFANANIGLMATLYKGDTFRVILGDNSDVVSNAIFDNSHSHMDYFKGHTFFLNLISRSDIGQGFFSGLMQWYYRMNMTQTYQDWSFKNGDEYGVSALFQFAQNNTLGYIGLKVGFKDSDILDGSRLHKHYFGGLGTGITVGMKHDFNEHFGAKVSVNYMNYAIDYNSSDANVTIGFYVK